MVNPLSIRLSAILLCMLSAIPLLEAQEGATQNSASGMKSSLSNRTDETDSGSSEIASDKTGVAGLSEKQIIRNGLIAKKREEIIIFFLMGIGLVCTTLCAVATWLLYKTNPKTDDGEVLDEGEQP